MPQKRFDTFKNYILGLYSYKGLLMNGSVFMKGCVAMTSVHDQLFYQ